MFRQKRNQAKDENKEFEAPLDELTHLLDKLEELVEKTMEEYVESIRPPPPEPISRRSGLVDSLKKFRSKRFGEGEEPPATPDKDENTTVVPETPDSASVPATPDSTSVPETPDPTSAPETPLKTPSSSRYVKTSNVFLGSEGIEAKFITMEQERVDQVVEAVRRIAELVVFGERAACLGAQHKQKLDKIAEKQNWGDEIMKEDEDVINMQGRDNEADKYIAIFEHFFERNGLELITKLLTGACFDLKTYRPKQKDALDLDKSLQLKDLEVAEDRLQEIDFEEHDYMLLPPLLIATQAIQSVSILVQNVSRATSLFFILSNNYVNQLINFPMEQYHVAERKKYNQESNGMSPRRFGSADLAELTTHFISFLKSLALRVNTETLQFFLTFPIESQVEEISAEEPDSPLQFTDNNPQDMDVEDERPLDEIDSNSLAAKSTKAANSPVKVKTVKADFPLYERALEFCSAHQESFVRVTAMNICLNILRLPTVRPDNEGEDGHCNIDYEAGPLPAGILHNAKALPLKERLAIAQYVCAPLRVEKLASPIFTKLAQIWGLLEEQFRGMDMNSGGGPNKKAEDDTQGRRKSTNEKVGRAKETARRQKSSDSFSDTAFNLQDELLLLEDVLKVGLTSLNEQVIEMMFATFVYPLLLQPLLLYFQRYPVPDEVLFADPLNDHSAGRGIKDSDLTASENMCGEKSLISSPTKSAFFSLAAVFQFITNQPLLRLLFTALLHPLSPGSTGETMIRAKADVACNGPDGKVTIRIDPVDENGKVLIPTDRSTYLFGKATGRKCVSGSSDCPDDNDTCIFVLSPALVEVLEFKGDDGALVARTRHNPYREAVFKCFTLSNQLSDLKNLSLLAVDSAVSIFDETFLSEILFGLDMKKFADNLPNDEKTSGSHLDFDDRGIGRCLPVESRMALGGPTGGKLLVSDPMNEVLSSFRSCLMNAVPGGNGTWKLEYDLVAAHGLLCVVRGNNKALQDAAKGIDRRCRQAAAFLSDMHLAVQKVGGKKIEKLIKGLADKEQKDDDQKNGTIMDMIFRGYDILGDSPSLLNDLFELKVAHRVYDKPGHSVSISSLGSYSVLCSRSCSFPPLDLGGEAILVNSMSSARAWVKLDAFSTLLNSLVATKAWSVRNRSLGGFAAKRDGSIVETSDPPTIYAPISESFSSALFDEDRAGKKYVEAQPGMSLSLVGHTAFPCVCEVPPSSAPLFSEEGAKVVSQGITWQSLYLVILGRNLVLAEPERRSSGYGRVVTCCRLERLVVERDSAEARADTSARRLILSHDGPDVSPPGLFLFEKTPSIQDEGPSIRLKQLRSSLDIWFEDSNAVELACKSVSKYIDEARAYRGNHLRKYLAQGEGSGYPTDTPVYRHTLEDTI